MDIEPHRVAKLSGIGCSSKTPDYFLGASHGFNTVHGRMPSVLTGANLANRDLLYLGVSGDGDSASIGLGQFANAMRRSVRMTYIVENNGVYGLTKGQFSATADRGSKSKKGIVNNDSPIDLVGLALQLSRIDFIPQHSEITTAYAPGELIEVRQHDGSYLRLRKLDTSYDPTNRYAALSYINEHQDRGEVVTGLLYLDPLAGDLHEALNTCAEPLNSLGIAELCPGVDALAKINASLR